MTDIRERTDMVGTQPVVGAPHPAVVHDAGSPAEEIVTPKLGVMFWICTGWLSLNILLVTFASLLPLPSTSPKPPPPKTLSAPRTTTSAKPSKGSGFPRSSTAACRHGTGSRSRPWTAICGSFAG